MIFKVWSPDQQHPYHLETCQKFLDTTPNLLNQKCWASDLDGPIKFENHQFKSFWFGFSVTCGQNFLLLGSQRVGQDWVTELTDWCFLESACSSWKLLLECWLESIGFLLIWGWFELTKLEIFLTITFYNFHLLGCSFMLLNVLKLSPHILEYIVRFICM